MSDVSKPTCRWVASDQPRVLVHRHADDCADHDTCRGCLPCPEPHCRVCNREHSDGACPECVASTRADLREIGRLCDALPEEVEHRGVDGEAMVLLGPAADYEARGHLAASVASGRVPADYLESADSEIHPLITLGTWDAVWRDALEHDDPNERLTIAAAVEYLDRTMAYMAGYEHVPFEDFARDVRRCVAKLEAVLHDQAYGDRANVGCFECKGDLERKIGAQGFDDFWTCQRCRRRYSYAEYNFALRAAIESDLEESA